MAKKLNSDEFLIFRDILRMNKGVGEVYRGILATRFHPTIP